MAGAPFTGRYKLSFSYGTDTFVVFFDKRDAGWVRTSQSRWLTTSGSPALECFTDGRETSTSASSRARRHPEAPQRAMRFVAVRVAVRSVGRSGPSGGRVARARPSHGPVLNVLSFRQMSFVWSASVAQRLKW